MKLATATTKRLRPGKIPCVEILVDRFVPTPTLTNNMFDIGEKLERVAEWLRKNGFYSEQCRTYRGEGLAGGGDFNPLLYCKYDLFADLSDDTQYRIAYALRILADALEFRRDAIGYNTGKSMKYVSITNLDNSAIIKFLNSVKYSEKRVVIYKYGENEGTIEF